jgi:Bacterial SH3 domain
MLPLPKFLTLPAILKTLFPPASPGKASEFPEKWAINGFYAIVGWSLLGAPNWSNASAPTITLPKLPEAKTPLVTPTTPVMTPVVTETTAFTTAATSTAVKPVSTVLVRCPGNIQVVNIRQGAGLTNVLGTVPCGDRVTLLGTDRISNGPETWIPIDYKGTKGWATARYLAL